MGGEGRGEAALYRSALGDWTEQGLGLEGEGVNKWGWKLVCTRPLAGNKAGDGSGWLGVVWGDRERMWKGGGGTWTAYTG